MIGANKSMHFLIVLSILIGCDSPQPPLPGPQIPSVLPVFRPDPDHEIFRLAKEGKLAELKAAADEEPAVLKKIDYTGWGLLYYAALGNRPDVVDYLVANGAKVDEGYPPVSTPMHAAASSGALEALQTLYRLGEKPKNRSSVLDQRVFLDFTVLTSAAINGRLGAVKFLLDRGISPFYEGPDLSRRPSRWTALHSACDGLNDRDARDDLQRVAEHRAVIDLLAKAVGDLNSLASSTYFADETPLHVAMRSGNSELVEYLRMRYPQMKIRVAGP